eukprot:Pompholyxophrys_punicea_v1_NODE_684_length_1459_cov_6.711538.p1 type:complete len:143 gc:universal NODE_684_length_1459_cov_6.711538:689-1117(+)
MIEDYLHQLNDRELAINNTLRHLEEILAYQSKSLQDFNLPAPTVQPEQAFSIIRHQEFDQIELQETLRKNVPLLNFEQRAIYQEILSKVENNAHEIGNAFFLNSPGGCGKGLANGTRLIITRLKDHFLEGKIIVGKNAGTYV